MTLSHTEHSTLATEKNDNCVLEPAAAAKTFRQP